MICTSIQHKNYEEILKVLETPGIEMAEIRLDRCPLTDEQIQSLFEECALPLVATCRINESANAAEAERKLVLAAQAGARFADLEVEAPSNISRHFQKVCKDSGTELIRSFHDFEKTPDAEYLEQVFERCRRYGAAVVKIVTTARCEEDVQRLFSLYDIHPKGSLLAFCMGEPGKQSRIDCLAKGAPYTYAALNEDDQTAPGQWGAIELSEKIYNSIYTRKGLAMPASKSFAQRAIVAAALAEGTSHLNNFSPCEDSLSALRVAEELGAKVQQDGSTLTITGIGPIKEPLGMKRLCTGESGLLTRLMIPIMSRINGESIVIDGEKTLLERPLNGAGDIMAAFGVMVSNEDASKGKTVKVPVKLRGQLIPGVADIPGKGGSQLISGLLMSLPLCDKSSKVYVGEPKSIPYMFITMDLLRHFGIKIGSEMEGNEIMLEEQDWSYCTGINFKIDGGQTYKAADFDIEGDWSAAANYLVAGAVFGSVEIDNLDCSSLQADLSIVDVLVQAGASVSQTEDGKVCVCKAPLEGFTFDLNNAPDLFPIVSVLAAFCQGRSRVRGVGRLRAKESDRAAAITGMLTQMGVPVAIEDDDMIIDGEALCTRILSGNLLKGGEYTSHHDHRMVMALRVAEMGAAEPIVIDDESCVAKSFPGFAL